MEIQNNTMKKSIKIFLTAAVLLIVSTTAKAQKKPFYNTQESAIEAAYKTLDYEMKEGKLIEWAKENGISGSYTMDIAIKGKGEVVTVRPLNRENGEIKYQNWVKDYIKSFRFPFKMPKDKSYQFQYEFKF